MLPMINYAMLLERGHFYNYNFSCLVEIMDTLVKRIYNIRLNLPRPTA